MSQISIKTLAFGSLLAALAFGVSGSSASAKSVTACKAGTRQGAIACCEDIVRKKGLPAWMKQSHKNCGSAAVCTGGGSPAGTLAAAPAMKCYIKYYQPAGTNNNGGAKSSKSGRGNMQ